MKLLLQGSTNERLCRRGGWLAAMALVALTGSLVKVQADTLVRGFKVSTALQPGIVVALSKNSLDSVEAAPANDLSRIYGVVIDPSDAPVTLNAQGQQAFVATSGNYLVLVSTENGTIKSGDYVSLSNTNGIAAKATDRQSFILGRALGFFDGKPRIFGSRSGFPVGKLEVSIAIGRNPLLKNNAFIPEPLRRVSDSLAGKPVSALRIYAALAALLTSITIASSIILVGVRSGMIAVGRNPLSKRSILRGLSQVTILAVLVFIIGLFGVYLLLKL